MTKDEILNMEAGREMDVLIAEKVMGLQFEIPTSEEIELIGPHSVTGLWRDQMGGWCIDGLPTYSARILDAWEVVEKSVGFMVENRQVYKSDEWECEIAFEGTYTYSANAHTAPLAICRAALLAKLEEIKE